MTDAQASAFDELMEAVKKEEEAQRASEVAGAAAEGAFVTLHSARVERSKAHDRLLQLARASFESPTQQ
jgi:hypothetical protein